MEVEIPTVVVGQPAVKVPGLVFGFLVGTVL